MTIDDQIKAQIDARTAIGIKQYGDTVDRTDVPPSEWRKHLQEELIDALKYNQKCINNENVSMARWIRSEIHMLREIISLTDASQPRAIADHIVFLRVRLEQLEDK